jgi:hypothetical protein
VFANWELILSSEAVSPILLFSGLFPECSRPPGWGFFGWNHDDDARGGRIKLPRALFPFGGLDYGNYPLKSQTVVGT